MKQTNNIAINYRWVNPKTNEIYTRYETQRHLLNELNKQLSENNIMQNMGFVKIENAGTATFIWLKE